jgi:methyl-accepting chemotaxis protein
MNLIHPNDRSVLSAFLLLFAGALGYAWQTGVVAATLAAGLALLAAATLVACLSKGRLASQIALPAIGMGLVALMIQAAAGKPEAHFAVFAFLAVTVVYRHWLPVIVAAGTIAVHHLSFNYFQQWMWGPICFVEPGLDKVIEHAAYVVAEAAILVMLATRAAGEHRAAEELRSIADGLRQRDGKVDFAAARNSYASDTARALASSLAEVAGAVGVVRHSVEAVTGSAQDVASESTALATRTTEALNRLETTATSLDEIARTVRETAESARQAEQQVEAATRVADRGGEAVARVVATMDDITAKSRRISEITGVIDGIAFQTNILALNAAVEAARAGEQGRGFAVVASEVRSLAQRSAQAAKEIKTLIGDSVESVQQGSGLVSDAGDTMQEIVAAVKSVALLVDSISSAASAQSAGIGLVSRAVGDLGAATQENAGIAQRSQSAAAELNCEAARLTAATQTFST